MRDHHALVSWTLVSAFGRLVLCSQMLLFSFWGLCFSAVPVLQRLFTILTCSLVSAAGLGPATSWFVPVLPCFCMVCMLTQTILLFSPCSHKLLYHGYLSFLPPSNSSQYFRFLFCRIAVSPKTRVARIGFFIYTGSIGTAS